VERDKRRKALAKLKSEGSTPPPLKKQEDVAQRQAGAAGVSLVNRAVHCVAHPPMRGVGDLIRQHHSAYREEACLGLGLDLALALALASSDAFRANLAAARSAVTLKSADTRHRVYKHA
jgi:hypothetical protein